MKFTVYTLADAGIDKARAHNIMNSICLKHSSRTTQMRVPTMVRGKLTDMLMHVRYLPVQVVINMAEDMLANGKTTTNKDKWRTILLIALKERGMNL